MFCEQLNALLRLLCGTLEHGLRATRASHKVTGIVHTRILIKLGQDLETLLMGTTVRMTNIATLHTGQRTPMSSTPPGAAPAACSDRYRRW